MGSEGSLGSMDERGACSGIGLETSGTGSISGTAVGSGAGSGSDVISGTTSASASASGIMIGGGGGRVIEIMGRWVVVALFADAKLS